MDTANQIKDDIIRARIIELEGTIKEALDVFDREIYQIETSFPAYTAIQRMKRALNIKK
jgi:hypothetical protein